MAEAPPNGNGNSHTTVVQAAIKLGQSVTHGLGPQFLALVLVNIVFMGAFVWYVDARARHSVVIIERLLASCLQQSR
jgi:hypothetical protein